MNSLELYVCEKELELYFKKWEQFNIDANTKLTSIIATRKRRRHYVKRIYMYMLRTIGCE